MSGRESERGAGTIMVALVASLVVCLTALGMVISAYVVAVHRARAAADLAVLAAAHAYAGGGDACGTAEQVARANAAVVAGCSVSGSRAAFAVTVTSLVPVPLRIPGASTSVTAVARAGTPAP